MTANLTNTQKRKLIRDLVATATAQTAANIQAKERAVALKGQKVYAAKLVAQISKDAGFKSPPADVKKNAIDKVKKAAADVQAKAKVQMAKHQKTRTEAEKKLFAALGI